jgi:hypothetical protein
MSQWQAKLYINHPTFWRVVAGRERALAAAVLHAIPEDVPVTIRRSRAADDAAIARLAALDDAPTPTGSLLVAEVAGELWAAVSIDGEGAIADPFRRSGGLLSTLELRARRLRGEPHGRPERGVSNAAPHRVRAEGRSR